MTCARCPRRYFLRWPSVDHRRTAGRRTASQTEVREREDGHGRRDAGDQLGHGSWGWPRGPGAVVLPVGRAGATGRRPGLTYRGVVYEVTDGETPSTGWSPGRMRRDLRAVAHDLHADSVKVTGDGVERLTATAAEAAELGLNVWLEPALGDVPEREILDHLAETGRFAERLLARRARECISVSAASSCCTCPGSCPAPTPRQRVAHLLKGDFDPVLMARRLHRFTAKAASVGRSVFHGRLTYAAAQDEDVDWGLFDLVGVHTTTATSGTGTPTSVTSPRCGASGSPSPSWSSVCCTFEGAPGQGRHGLGRRRPRKEPPEIKGGLVRSERTQAAYLTDVLSVFESMGRTRRWRTPSSPPTPRTAPATPATTSTWRATHIVKTIEDRHGGWHWEPKESFRALARHYARSRAHTC